MSAQDDLNEIKKLLADRNVRLAGKTIWRGEEVTFDELIILRDEADAAVDAEKSQRAIAATVERREGKVAGKERVDKRNQIKGLERLVSNANTDLTRAIDKGGDVGAARTKLLAEIERLRAVDPQNKLVPQEAQPVLGQPKVGDEVVGTLTLEQTRALAKGKQPSAEGTKLPLGTVVDKQSVRVTNTEVTTALRNKGLADTPANRKTVRDQIKAGKAKPVDENAWIETFNKDYPAYSDWTTDQVVSYFGQDFVDIIKSTVESGVEYSNEELKALLKNTTYFNSVSDKQYKFDTLRDGEQNALIETSKRAIVDEFGDVGLSETDLAEIAKTAARSGLTGTGLKQTVYQYAFRKGGMATAPTSPAMATRALEGSDADAIRKSARAYGYQVSDAEVEAALTGGMYNGLAVSKDSILEKAQKAAKGKYFHLADQIDAGLSLDDIFGTYKKYAAALLEVDENEIDYLSDPKWSDAFGSKDTGQLSLTDWTQKIKSDSKFGWQFTKQANDQATDIALTLARAFGKVQ
jgi:hypothetical protein